MQESILKVRYAKSVAVAVLLIVLWWKKRKKL